MAPLRGCSQGRNLGSLAGVTQSTLVDKSLTNAKPLRRRARPILSTADYETVFDVL
jgi:hypothetical protein